MIRVTCALIEENGKVLAAQRSPAMRHPLKWEFPGGKVEPDESDRDCLIREIQEELGIQIEIVDALSPCIHHYPEQSLILIPFICKYTGGNLHAREHARLAWLDHDALRQLDWAAADVPVVQEYLEKGGAGHV